MGSWRRIDCPTLLVRGANSWAGDPQEDGSLAALSDGRQVSVADAAHWVMHDNFDAFVHEADAFLG